MPTLAASAGMPAAIATASARSFGAADSRRTAAPRDGGYAEPFSRGYWVAPATCAGILTHSYGDEHLFNRVWVRPVRIDCGFITEERAYSIEIWNAWLRRTARLEGVAAQNGEGTGLSFPLLPHTIAQSGALELALTVYEAGPPLQDTRWRLLIDATAYEVYVTGIRVLGFWPDPNWEEGFDFEYEFQTVVFTSERLREQRRPLSEISSRRLRASFLLSGVEAQRFLNLLMHGHDKLFGVPIYQEKLVPVSAPQGGNTLTLASPTDNLWNLQNRAAYVALVDHGRGVAEVKELASVASTSIVTATGIVNAFDLASTFVYPVFFALLQSARVEHASDACETVELELREYQGG